MLKLVAVSHGAMCAVVAQLVCAGAAAASAVPQLAEEPVALAWTAGEVEHASAEGWKAVTERASREGQAGCHAECGRVQSVFHALLVVARSQTPRARQLAWSLTVGRVPGVRALSFAGGQIVVSQEFTAAEAPRDEALAFVLAHEMAHCVLEHERQALTFARMLLPREVPRSVADVYAEIDYNFALLESMEPVLHQGEFEADELGLLMASAAGFAPGRQLEFMERQARRGGADTSVMRSHPAAAERLQRLRERLPLAERVYAAALAGRVAATAWAHPE